MDVGSERHTAWRRSASNVSRYSTLRDLVDRAVPLTEYAWKFRYPGEPEGPAPVEAEEAFGIAREVVAAILARLPVDTRP
jgi:hypothetical protein